MKKIYGLMAVAVVALSVTAVEGLRPEMKKVSRDAKVEKLAVSDNIAPVKMNSAPAKEAEEADEPEWLEVTLETAGSLGVEVLYKVDQLKDVKYLKVTGPMNDDDWRSLNNMTTIVGLDLSQASCKSMLAGTFYGRTSLQQITLPPNLEVIGENALRSTSVKNLVIPATVKTINNYAFYESKVESVVFEDAGQELTMGVCVFYDCNSLKSVKFPEHMKSLPGQSLDHCDVLNEVVLSKDLFTIDSYAFRACPMLKSVELPASLRVIGEYAFQYSGIETLSIPNKVYSIGSGCFWESRIQEITMPAGVQHYTTRVFLNCSNLKKINIASAVPPTVDTSYPTFQYVDYTKIDLCVPDFVLADYKLNTFWGKFKSVNGGITSDYYLFNGEVNLTDKNRLDNTPEVLIIENGKLTISGNVPQEFGEFWYRTSSYYNVNANVGGQFINKCGNVSANVVKSVLYPVNSRWYFFSPAFDVKLSDVAPTESADYVVRYYDGEARALNGTGGSWKNVPADGTLKAGNGYIMMSNKNVPYVFTATGINMKQFFNPNGRVVELAANESETAANAGWNLVGNPFPSYYDTYYLMLSAPITYWDLANNTYKALSLIDDQVVLAPGQAFFIQATEDITELNFAPAGRQLGTVSTRPQAPAREAGVAPRSIFNLTISANNCVDETRIVMNEDAEESYESGRDAAKFFSDTTDVAQLYTINETGDNLAINERPELDGTVALGYYAPAACEMTIAAPRADGQLILIDNKTGKQTELSNGEAYTFTADAKGFDDGRFALKIKGTVTAVNTIAAAKATALNGKVLATAADAEVYGIDGTLVAKMKAGEEVELGAGVYVVRCGASTVKYIVR